MRKVKYNLDKIVNRGARARRAGTISFMNIKQDRHLWTFWDYFLIGLELLSVFIANIFIYYLYQGTVFVVTNFFYIPVIFAAFHDPKRGIFVSSSLALLYFGVIYTFLSQDPTAITSGTMQFYVFVAVGTLVSHLSNELREQESPVPGHLRPLRGRGLPDRQEGPPHRRGKRAVRGPRRLSTEQALGQGYLRRLARDLGHGELLRAVEEGVCDLRRRDPVPPRTAGSGGYSYQRPSWRTGRSSAPSSTSPSGNRPRGRSSGGTRNSRSSTR